MYNLLVTAQSGAWDKTHYKFDRSRFREYTNDDIAESFKVLTEAHKSRLKSLPCLFAYEGTEGVAKIGTLTNIAERDRELLIEFQFDKSIAPIPFKKLNEIGDLLDIRSWEMNRTHWAIKDEDLMRRLGEAGLIRAPRKRVTARKEESLPVPDTSSSAIDSLEGFVKQVLASPPVETEVFYRGHSTRRYKLEPQLFRKDSKGNYLYLDYEHVLYRELLVSNSADFAGDIYTLDRLVRMQHYALPTRLLDITSNPLIALFFACRSKQGYTEAGKVVAEEDGEVIRLTVKRDQVKYFDSDTAGLIANLARLPKSDKLEIDFTLERTAFNEQLAVKRLIHLIHEEKPFFESRIEPKHLQSIVCVKGKRTNDRIAVQSGAFLLFGADASLGEAGNDEVAIERIVVRNKAQVLRQLDLLNINESTVFPYIENSSKYIAERFKFHGPSAPNVPAF
jgi:hypothetical protein